MKSRRTAGNEHTKVPTDLVQPENDACPEEESEVQGRKATCSVTQLVSDQSGISMKLCLSSLLPGLVITALYLTLRITVFFHT